MSTSLFGGQYSSECARTIFVIPDTENSGAGTEEKGTSRSIDNGVNGSPDMSLTQRSLLICRS